MLILNTDIANINNYDGFIVFEMFSGNLVEYYVSKAAFTKLFKYCLSIC